MDGWKELNRHIYRCKEKRTVGRMERWMDERRTNTWMDHGWTDWRIDGL